MGLRNASCHVQCFQDTEKKTVYDSVCVCLLSSSVAFSTYLSHNRQGSLSDGWSLPTAGTTLPNC